MNNELSAVATATREVIQWFLSCAVEQWVVILFAIFSPTNALNFLVVCVDFTDFVVLLALATWLAVGSFATFSVGVINLHF